jgi:hypothetical protein
MELGDFGIWTSYRSIGEENAGEAAKLVEDRERFNFAESLRHGRESRRTSRFLFLDPHETALSCEHPEHG